MSLIKCPECGKEISDKASSCPNCGYPIATTVTNSNTISEDVRIRIDLSTPETFLSPSTSGSLGKLGMFICRTGEQLWTGRSGDVAIIKITQPEEVELRTILFNKPAKNAFIKQIVEPGCSYEIKAERTPFSFRYVFRRVDVIST